MEISQLIQSGNYINEFKKHKVVYSKYPKLGLLIAKQKIWCDLFRRHTLAKLLSWISDKL